MSKKIMFFLFCSAYLLQAAEPHKIKIESRSQLQEAVQEEKAKIYKRHLNPNIATQRNRPRVDGNPDQQKNIQEKK